MSLSLCPKKLDHDKLQLMRSREGWAARQWLAQKASGIIRLADFYAWTLEALSREPSNPYWVDLVTVKLPLEMGVLSFVQNVDKELRNGGKASTCGIHAGI